MVLPNTPSVRSRKTIIKGLLSRAFAKSQEAGEKMQLLIEWRLAACRHSNRKALRNFHTEFKLADMQGQVSSGSRGIDAFNWISTIEGRNDRLTDEAFEARIKEMERMHHISRFFKNSEIKVDLEALVKASRNSKPDSPIIVDVPLTQPNQRSKSDIIYLKSNKLPDFMTHTLAEIDAWVDDFDEETALERPSAPPSVMQAFDGVNVQSKIENKIKGPDVNQLAFLQVPKPKFGMN